MSLIQLRGGTEAEWDAADPVLADRELGVTTDTHRIKVGDGVLTWAELPWAGGGGSLLYQDEPPDDPEVGDAWVDSDADSLDPTLWAFREITTDDYESWQDYIYLAVGTGFVNVADSGFWALCLPDTEPFVEYPSPYRVRPGKMIVVKNSGAETFRLYPYTYEGAVHIDGEDYILMFPMDSLTLVSTGTNWVIV